MKQEKEQKIKSFSIYSNVTSLRQVLEVSNLDSDRALFSHFSPVLNNSDHRLYADLNLWFDGYGFVL